MILLTDWSTAWLMTGMGVGIVFCILVILVLILQFMGNLNAHKQSQKASQSSEEATSSHCAEGKPSEADLAAVATAVHLYQNDLHDIESGVLTWHPTETAWHSELNPTL